MDSTRLHRPSGRDSVALTLSRVVLGIVLVALGVTGVSGLAGAQDDAPDPTSDGTTDAGVAQVVKVSGLLDPILVDFVAGQIADAPTSDVVAVVLQINSSGAAVSEERMDELVEAIETSPIPVTAWVGSGASATGEATRLLEAASVSGMAPGSGVEVTRALVEGIDLDGRTAVGERIGSDLAIELGLVDNAAPVLGEFIIDLPGVETQLVDGRTEPITTVRFSQLGLLDQLLHTVASPEAAYLLLMIGGSLLVFELFTAGVGVAGMVGAGSLILAAYGLGVLDLNVWALVVLSLSFVAFAVDVQTGIPRFWTGVGTVFLVVGSLALYADGPPSWISLLAGIVGVLLAMIGGMPPMVRTRFSTPTIGRDWMIGETGTAVAAVDPDGVVTVRDAPWRAHTNRATPIGAGDEIRVTAIDGLVLEVEPIDGAAKDYRRH
mgnify:CR=1 FL=1